MSRYDGQVVVEAEHRAGGWHLALHHGTPESAFFTGLFSVDAEMRFAAPDIGRAVVEALIAARDAS
jgi:hypothetical protein